MSLVSSVAQRPDTQAGRHAPHGHHACFFPGRGQVPPDSMNLRQGLHGALGNRMHGILASARWGQHLSPGYQTQPGPGHTLSGPRRQAPLKRNPRLAGQFAKPTPLE
jgi:hypothetical protein